MARINIFLEAIIFSTLILSSPFIVVGVDPVPTPGAPAAAAGAGTPVPKEKAEVNAWFDKNIGPLSARKATLDPALVAAESAPPKTINMKADGSGDFKTLTEAIASIPENNKARVIIKLGPGNYTEKVAIPRTKHFVTMMGDPKEKTILVFGGTAAKYGTVESATLQADGDYFVAVNLIIVNSAPRPNMQLQGGQAAALRIGGDKAAFYSCKFYGFQDTLCDDKGLHLFKDCYIEGTVDFIFGNGKSIYLNNELHVIPGDNQAWITAQARHTAAEDTGYLFMHCSLTGTGGNAYLGRAWMPFSRVVFVYTEMSDVVIPVGWSDTFHDQKETPFFGEFGCTGAGANMDKRAPSTKKLTEADAKPFLTLDYIEASKWLLPPPS